jgi:hypothetical protein
MRRTLLVVLLVATVMLVGLADAPDLDLSARSHHALVAGGRRRSENISDDHHTAVRRSAKRARLQRPDDIAIGVAVPTRQAISAAARHTSDVDRSRHPAFLVDPPA